MEVARIDTGLVK